MFNDIKIFLEKYDYEFIDFLNILRWRRNEYNHTGQPQISDILLAIERACSLFSIAHGPPIKTNGLFQCL